VTSTTTTSYDVRARLEDLLERDLLGPWDGPDEELPPGSSPGERYLLGRLVPRRHEGDEPATDVETPEDDGVEDRPELVADEGIGLEGDDERPSTAAVRTRTMAASSLGLSFTVPPDVDVVLVTASWGRYEKTASEHHETPQGRKARVWRRASAGGEVEVRLEDEGKGKAVPDGHQEGVLLRWTVRHRQDRRIVEVFLLNEQPDPPGNPDAHRLFQAGLTVTALDGNSAVLAGHNDPQLPELRRDRDPELRLLAMQHRRQRLFSTGRQCAVDAEMRPDEDRAWRLRTTCFPVAEVALVQPGDPADMPGLETDMARLGSPELSPDDLEAALRPLADGYTAWLDTQRARLDVEPELARYRDVAEPALDRAGEVAERLGRAIDLLRQDAVAREAFRFANQAMAGQRARSELVRERAAHPEATVRSLERRFDDPRFRSWRPFQLAFVLLCLPGLTDPGHVDADRGPLMKGRGQLLFFPTGGGKTEAYLGLTAYTLAIRRLQGVVGSGSEARDGSRGVAVLMRYTLRLLTAQQFQRATALIAACELLRIERTEAGDLRWGTEPMRIGLWVGSSVTPNNFDEATRQLEDAASRAGEGQVGGLLQFATCPWCGTPLDLGRDATADKLHRRIRLFCGDGDGRCPFSRTRSADGLPAVLVDEEIYRLTPDLVIATVDKFAALPWRSSTAHLFGLVSSHCERHGWRSPDTEDWCKDGGHPKAGPLPAARPEDVEPLRPPDLIIQDELHLISDALGSMVGLYETVIDRLCTRSQDGTPVRPVLVASTATVRRAAAQVREVFARDLCVFPPPVLDAGDTFFSRRVASSPTTPGRRYRGIMAPGERLTAVEIRVMTALLEFGQLLLDEHGEPADPYCTVVDYFTSTRELAGMRRLVEDDVTDRLGRREALVRRRSPTVSELTSRMNSGKITQSLADLDRRFEPEQDSSDGLARLRQLRKDDKVTYDRVVRHRFLRPVDVLLATSMLQVGVDVQRLGLMVVTGQPKNMAEYIQASSRVGRDAQRPGLVVTIYQWSRPRDLAHYEHFAYEHATFGRRVEGLTTTPFSERALDRGLTGVLVGALRLASAQSRPNLGAHTRPLDSPVVVELLRAMHDRAALSSDSAPLGLAALTQAQERVDAWVAKRARQPAGQLGYVAGAQAAAGLLKEPDEVPWQMWSAPRSLRDVEPEVLLQLRRDDPTWVDAPTWDFSPKGDDQ